MLIGELARKAGVSRDTIRYYEKRGLLRQPMRLDNSYRDYSDESMRRLQFIARLKGLGFTLREIASLLDLYEARRISCSEAGSIVRGRIEQIDSQIDALTCMKKCMQEFFSPCRRRPRTSMCRPLISLLE